MSDNPTIINQNPECKSIRLNPYTVTRIVYEIIKTYMLTNTPDEAGVKLVQKFDADPKKSQILLDISYNWRTKDMSKVPAIFVGREDVEYKTPTMGQNQAARLPNDPMTRFALGTIPVVGTCVAAEPLAVVEQLAEYIKQPLLYFRDEVQKDYGIRRFQLTKVTKPKLLPEGKNNFFVELIVDITFDEGWVVNRDTLVLKHICVELFDQLMQPLATVLD